MGAGEEKCDSHLDSGITLRSWGVGGG